MSHNDRPAVDLLRQLLIDDLAHIKYWRPVAIAAKDTEGVHQVRVSLRRMRTVLSLYKPLLPHSFYKELNKNLKEFAHSLDRARDLDVLMLCHQTQQDELPAAFFKALKAERRHAYKPVRKLLKGERFKKTMKRYRKWLEKKAWKRKVNRSHAERLDDFAAKTLDSLYQQVMRQTKTLDLNDENALHQLRISCKKLRYASEFFYDVFDPDASKDFVQHLKLVQDRLGDIHDFHVHGEVYTDLSDAMADSKTHNVLHQMIMQRRDNSEQLKQGLLDDFRQLEQLPNPWI